MSRIKIYTRTGDKGQTSLIGGTRVPKFHPRIEAYGTIDELNSYIGLIRDQDIDMYFKDILLEIQDRLFTAESIIALDPAAEATIKLPELNDADITFLEQEIDHMNEVLPELKSFILPGGHPVVSYCHVARCVCRRAERHTIRLARSQPVEEKVIQYLNRLSDFLFVLARRLGKDLGATETAWKART
ncbi:MAG: cob(I)yrinic acid a,c-diamide adenosyltransferase [Bacteroidales bacterium]|nr:cob(I)yrinic acid a,c-diamide adenosyltransferase [Bacteroidales bacterium]